MDEGIVLSEESYEVDHVKHSVGGMGGHLFRRGIHLSLAIFPILYYWYGEPISTLVGISPQKIVFILVCLIVAIELVRLKIGITIVGQRDYEAHQMSAMCWGSIAIAFAVIFSPEVGTFGAALGAPLVWSLAFGDPAMGETRRAGKEPKIVFLVGLITVYLVWIIGWYFLATPLIFALLIPPIQVASEWPRLRWIDDNGTMVLIPLVVVIILAAIVL
jgi:hypothetical protein